ncbi:MAG: tetratricopeptide repeat protein [Bacteroidota bacterium]
MFNIYTRIASFVLAFGLFISCSTFQSTNQSSESSQDLTKKELENRIDAVDDDLNDNPEMPQLFFEKGKLLTKLAQRTDDPSERSSPYSDAETALTNALDLYSNSEQAEQEEIRDLLNVTWSLEHNQGVQLLQGETSDNPDYADAAAHFNNATIIIPDSAISYTMQAQALYQNEQPDQAIQVLTSGREHVDNPPPKLLEQLAFLYLETDSSQQAIAVYEDAESFSNKNTNLLHGLSNAYISAGEHQKAIELLEQLLENEPQNIIYSQSLATEYYLAGKDMMDSVATELENDSDFEDTNFTAADSLLKKAEEHFNNLVEANPGDEELMSHFARFYYNSASTYQQLIPLAAEEYTTKLEDQVEQHLSASIPLLETIVEQHPSNKTAWEDLYKAYSIMGMEQEAENAKANL